MPAEQTSASMPPRRLLALLGRGPNLVPGRDIDSDARGLRADPLDGRRDGRTVAVPQADGAALGRDAARDRETDAGCTAGDDGTAALETCGKEQAASPLVAVAV